MSEITSKHSNTVNKKYVELKMELDKLFKKMSQITEDLEEKSDVDVEVLIWPKLQFNSLCLAQE